MDHMLREDQQFTHYVLQAVTTIIMAGDLFLTVRSVRLEEPALVGRLGVMDAFLVRMGIN